MYRSTAALALLAALTACATSSPDVVNRNDAQIMSTVIDAVVLSVRPVTIDGGQSGAGAIAGGAIGAIAGSSVGRSGSNEAAIASVLGAVAGGILGNAAERTGTREEALEIMVQLRSGERRSIVQAKGTEALAPGDAVIIVSTGNRVRVTRAPTVAPPPAPANNSSS
jgi:outer membrane lipoprotein SlyB